MKTGYYIHFEGSKTVGVYKKILMQIGILKKYSECMEVEINVGKRSLLNRLRGLLFWESIPWDYESAKALINSPDYIYIRRVNLDLGVYRFYRYLRGTYPDTVILLEIPTYPYDKQSYRSIGTWPFAIKDYVLRKKIHNVIDGIVVYSDNDVIWNVQAVSARNGVDYSTVKLPEQFDNDNVIDLLTVSSFQKDHGYERVIEGMRNYYAADGKRDIQLHMVGNGSEVAYYQELVNKYSLQDRVLFCGERRGEELEEMYQKSDIGLGCFGLYKSGLTHISSLKICEYLSKGLPVVFAGTEDILKDRKEEYVLEYENNASDIDIEKIIDLYDRYYGKSDTKLEVRQRIREDSYSIADMENNYRPVLKYLGVVD